jgi:hypothetical protein
MIIKRKPSRWIVDESGHSVMPRHRWFAWYPVPTRNSWVWLDYVYRTGHLGFRCEWFEYEECRVTI